MSALPRRPRLMMRCLTLLISVAFIGSLANAQLIDQTLLADTEGGRWAISVRTLDGAPVATVNAENRIVPASTIKLLTTGAAMHYLGDFSNAGWPDGTSVYLHQASASGPPDLVLTGSGDATLSSDDGCTESCLRDVALAVRASGIEAVGAIRVDDSLFETPYWPAGWAHDDLRFAYGTAISALTVNDGSAHATISPGASLGSAPRLEWETVPAFNVDVTGASTSQYGFDLEFGKKPGSSWAEITGTIGLNAGHVDLRFGVDDPSIHAGRLFRQSLLDAGVSVTGQVVRNNDTTASAVSGFEPRLLYRQARPDPAKTLIEILHESNNVHAEVLLHHVSLTFQDKTADSALFLLSHILMESGATEQDFNLQDGSGLSFYNRITPHAMSGFLSWASRQSWFGTWWDLLPRNGLDGTLEYRLSRGVTDGAVRAKSGTVYGADGLAGYFTAASGSQYAFAIYLNDSALSHAEARGRIDAVVRSMIATL